MARGESSAASGFRMIALGETGEEFRPSLDYFSISLRAVHVPGKALNLSRFAPVVWAAVKHQSFDGEKTLIGLFPSSDASKPQFFREDRIHAIDLQLTPRIVATEEMTIDFTLGSIKQKDYLAGALKLVADVATSPAASFVSQLAPVLGGANQVAQIADAVKQNLDSLMDNDKLQRLGQVVYTLRAPIRSGLFAFTESRAKDANISFDGASNQLLTSDGPMKAAYAVLEFRREETRPDWMALPDVNQAWLKIREATVNGGDVPAAIDYFFRTAASSPDLTRADADRLKTAAEAKFAHVMAGAESAGMGDPGDLWGSLHGFMPAEGAFQPDSGEESAILTGVGGASRSLGGLAARLGGIASVAITKAAGQLAAARAATPPASGPAPASAQTSAGITAKAAMPSTIRAFATALRLVLEHEGGFVDHPADPGGATNKGVTQKTYDDYRTRTGQPTRSVRELTPEEIDEIYFAGYWLPARCSEMPNEALSLLMFDAAVNHGPGRAVKLLQKASGVPASQCNGEWSGSTLKFVMQASANVGALVDACLLQREALYRAIVAAKPSQSVFLNGWLNRIASLRRHVEPFLGRVGAGGGAESALIEDDGERAPLVAAPPEFGDWLSSAPGRVATQ